MVYSRKQVQCLRFATSAGSVEHTLRFSWYLSESSPDVYQSTMSAPDKKDGRREVATRQEELRPRYPSSVHHSNTTSWTQMLSPKVAGPRNSSTALKEDRSSIPEPIQGRKGAIQSQHMRECDTVITDFGWKQDHREIPDPLLDDISNEDLWAMIRRFNKVRESHNHII